jgi:hypothetical protein
MQGVGHHQPRMSAATPCRLLRTVTLDASQERQSSERAGVVRMASHVPPMGTALTFVVSLCVHLGHVQLRACNI